MVEVCDKMNVMIIFIVAIIFFIIGIIIKAITDINFNGLLAVLGALTFMIPFIIAIYNIMNNPSDTEVASENIEYFVESFANYLPGAIIGDIAALLVTKFLDATGIRY